MAKKTNVEQGKVEQSGSVEGIMYGISNDGGKTAVYWRDSVIEAMDYFDDYFKTRDYDHSYCVVAVRKPNERGESHGR